MSSPYTRGWVHPDDPYEKYDRPYACLITMMRHHVQALARQKGLDATDIGLRAVRLNSGAHATRLIVRSNHGGHFALVLKGQSPGSQCPVPRKARARR